jgi:hypothetical protein
MGEETIDKLSKYIGNKFSEGMIVSAEILNAQKMQTDQVAPPYRMSPYVGLSFYTREWSDQWSKRVIDITQKSVIPDILREVGKMNPRQEMVFWEDDKYYLEKYKEMKEIRENERDYKSVIENNMKKSDIYPYKGQLRPSFRKEGLLSEIEWAVDKLLRRERGSEELIRLYHEELDVMMFDEYPHE